YYFLMVGLASLFHVSVLITIPLYFLPYKRMYNQKFWFIAFIVTFFLSNIPSLIGIVIDMVVKVGDVIPVFSRFVRYIFNERFFDFRLDVGLGYVFKLLVSLSIIYFSKRTIEVNPKTRV